MAFRITDQLVGAQPIATTETSSTKNHPLGTVVRAVDPTYGEGEFIYLIGVASTTVGAIVNYDVATTLKWQTALETTAIADSSPIAVAMSANVAGDFGWYQISGLAVVSKLLATSMVVGDSIQAAAGECLLAVTSKVIQGAIVSATASANTSDSVLTVEVMIQRPAMNAAP